MMGALSLMAGVICMLVSIFVHARDIKNAGSAKGKWMEVFGFILDPFTGLTALFYLGVLLGLYGACIMAGLL